MNKIYQIGTAVALTTGALAGCGSEKVSETSAANVSTPSQNILAEFDIATDDYIRMYGCLNEVQVVLGETGEGASNGENTIAIAIPGLVTLDTEDWVMLPPAERRKTALHELTHSCKPIDPTPIEPLLLSDGVLAVATHGLSLLVTLPDGTNTGFRKIEEGAAEALAYILDPSYTTSSEEYYRLGSLTLNLMDQHGITAFQLVDYIKHNDLFGYIGAMYSSGRANIQQLLEIMTVFDQA